MTQISLPPASRQQGVVLIEAMVAILLFSVGVLAVVGLQATMLKNTSESKFRADAGYIAQQRIGELWVRPDNLPLDGTSDTVATKELPNGEVTIARAGDVYTVTVNWKQPGDDVVHTFSTAATIVGN